MKRIEKMILANGCHTSPISVVPKNWYTTKASIQKDWIIQYRFYDPEFPKPKVVQIRGMNSYKDLPSRQAATRSIIETEVAELKKGYNPFLNDYMQIWQEESEDFIIHPDTPWIVALDKALERLTVVKSTKDDIQSVINGVKKASGRLRMSDTKIKDIRRRHILSIFDQCKIDNKKFSDFRRNRYREYLNILFNELVEVEATELNPVIAIRKIKGIKRAKRETLTQEQREKIDKHLKAKHYPFWRFLQIFYHSGTRITEFMRMKTEDVNLKQQTFKVTVLKGRQATVVEKVIKDVAMPLWSELLKSANKGQYLFSRGLNPGDYPIRPDQINKRWKRNVKEPLGITADFYSIKHSHTEDTVNNTTAKLLAEVQKIAESAAANLNGHTTTDMVKKVYDVNNKARMDEIIRKLDNKFA